ncbi:MAG: NapC/NirT family cytochrome c [Fimbriimonadaceae bacterium]|nr:NapC/NirT family cytochrome c [Fimbriimonadaceae bacterium]
MKRRLPDVFYNTTSLIGMTIFGISFCMIVFLFILDSFSRTGSPYLGLITFIALPGVMLFGLFVALVGLYRAVRRKRRGEEAKRLPTIDFNESKQRFAFLMFLFGGLGLMLVSGFGSYQAYEYTESVKFCGETCHNVMKPEYVAYQHSPHAKVKCAECHIGAGTDWYVRSKISGSYQVYSTLFNKYSRPIETPVANLRPARETCEHCHWPDHFYSQKLKDRKYFLSDPENTEAQISMLMKIGGVQQGASEGIHAHMYIENEISYVSTDRQRQIIPYVESKDKNGKVTVYRSTELKATDEDLKKGERRIVDCIDCHNRPSHQYRPPEVTLNQALARNLIDRSIPEIKMTAKDALEKPYKTEAEAIATIRADILKYYQDNYKDQFATLQPKLVTAIAQVQEIYRTNYFPEMKVSWKGYPSNLDHVHSLGCFRCHDDKHVSPEGKVLTKNCQTCHTILSQVPPGGKRETNVEGLAFKHPVDIGDAWQTGLCMDCHGPQKDE